MLYVFGQQIWKHRQERMILITYFELNAILSPRPIVVFGAITRPNHIRVHHKYIIQLYHTVITLLSHILVQLTVMAAYVALILRLPNMNMTCVV